MQLTLEPSILPWFAPLPEPMIIHLLYRLGRNQRTCFPISLQELYEQVLDKRASTYFYMDPFIQARLRGGPATVSFSTGWLLRSLGGQSPGKKEAVSQKTLSYWRGKGLIRFQQHGIPDYGSAAALYMARIIDSSAERSFLPSSMAPDEQDWWCFTQVAPGEPVVPWRASHLCELPPSTFCWTPWLGAEWEPGWIKRQDQTIAMRWAHLAQEQPLTYDLLPADIYRWYPSATLPHLSDPDIIQATAMLVLHHLGRQRKARFVSTTLPKDVQGVQAMLAKGAGYDRVRTG